ncbi:hypothetical protein NDU88_003079 [Pleurodeles waltl]|uniref:Uncharacterized protein n=1 Tax=Pleurodeles waltl TaxID=8319 RepID=A0AAV7MA08_PLEWA|nr:hypothetical protein NDU88_003079 [Pleurodeles waltl]
MGAKAEYPWDTPMRVRNYVRPAQPDAERSWEKPRGTPEREKPARGKRGERRASWRSWASRIRVKPCQRRRKMKRRRRRWKEGTAQSRECPSKGSRKGECQTRKPATFLEECGLSRYVDGQEKEVKLSERREKEFWE